MHTSIENQADISTFFYQSQGPRRIFAQHQAQQGKTCPVHVSKRESEDPDAELRTALSVSRSDAITLANPHIFQDPAPAASAMVTVTGPIQHVATWDV